MGPASREASRARPCGRCGLTPSRRARSPQVWRWSPAAGQFEPFQKLPTTGAHHVAHAALGGRDFLVFAQYRGIDEVSLATSSPVFEWDAKAGAFALVLEIPTSAALRAAPFAAGGRLYVAFANFRDAASGMARARSTVRPRPPPRRAAPGFGRRETWGAERLGAQRDAGLARRRDQ